MSTLPKISIVTPSFNSIHTLRATLARVAQQDYPNVEHIVVDGGSTDGTLEILKSTPRLIWVSEKDEGHYHAMDKGTRMASGEVVAVLNSDDCYRPGVLSQVAAAVGEHPEWDGVFGDMVYVDGEGREIFRRQEAMFDRQVIRFGHNIVNHQTLFVKKAIFVRVGGYRYKDYKNCCDYELVMRLIRAGCYLGHIPVYIVDYRYHDYGQSADLRVRANMMREAELIKKEYGVPGGLPGRALLLYARLKRQFEKLVILRKCDLIPGNLLLRKHLRARTSFSSNSGVDKL
jgi:glycosyltransferase involved in cell wall biosynthesis